MRYFLLLILFFYTPWLFAQSSWVETKQQVKKYCLNEKFEQALDLLESNKIALRTDEEGLFLKGVCLYHLNRLDQARQTFSDILDGRKTPVSEVLLYLARIYHSRHQFDKAVELYKEYLKVLNPKHPYRPLIRDEIKMCANGIQMQFRQNLAYVENLGGEVNSPYDEFGPIPSPNGKGRLYFSSDRPGNFGGPRNQYGQPDEFYGHHTNDIFYCENKSGIWTNTQRMHFLINSNAHDIIFGFDPSGRVMYYYQGRSLENGRILMDTFQRASQRRLSVNPFLGPVRANADYAMPFFQGDSVVVFSSDQMGGYGGKDLFMSVSVNGRWSPPQNLGPQVNSAYDETTPYLTDGGEALYFSSNNPDYSMGGFDILKSFFDKGKRDWYLPLNLGIPINSAGDDAYFRLGYDGYSAFFSSNRKDGQGKRDIFIAYFNDEVLEKPVLVAQTPKQDRALPPEKEPPAPPKKESPPPPAVVAPNKATDPFSSAPSSDPFATNNGNTTSVPNPPSQPEYEFPRGAIVQIPSIVFDDPGSILKNRGEAQFKQLLNLTQRYPQLKLIVSVYSAMGVSVADRLLNGTIQAEKFANYFIQNGMRAENIQIRGLDGTGLKALGGKLFALELDVSGKKEIPVQVQAVTLSLDQVPENRLVYKLQFAEQSQFFEDPLFEKSEKPLVEKTSRLFRYMAGDFKTYQEAKDAFDRLSRKRRETMKVVVFAEGIRLNENEWGRFAGMYPDLNEMIKAQQK